MWARLVISWLMLLVGVSLPLDLRAQDQPDRSPEPAAASEAVSDFEQKAPAVNRVFRSNENWSSRHRTVFGENVVVRTNETIRDLVLFGGTADIQGTVEDSVVIIGGTLNLSGSVERDVVVIGGRCKISGRVDDNLVVVLGSALLTETAEVEENAVLIGGPFEIASDKSIAGKHFTLPLGDIVPQLEWLKAWVVRGPLWGRWLTFNAVWPWIIVGIFSAVYLLALLMFPRAGKAVSLTLEDQPIASIVSGILTLILFGPLAALLVISVVGILAVPFLQLALLALLLFGKIGLIYLLGRSFGRALGGSVLQGPFLAFIAGALLLALAYAVPIFGILVWALATVFGLGGAVVALGANFKSEQAAVTPVPVMVSTLRPTADPARPAPHPPAPAAPPIAALNPADTVLLARAGFWRRTAAAALDLLFLTLLIVLTPLIGPFLIPLAVLYFVIFWTWKGTSLGGMLLGLKIVRINGGPVTFSVAVVRSLLSLFSGAIFFLGFLWAAWDREKQTWHDKVAGTLVVKLPRETSFF